MKKAIVLLCLLSAGILLTGCRYGHEKYLADRLIHINMTGQIENTPVYLNDFVEHIRIIRLETTEESLISNFRGFVGDKHIIAMEQESIMHFSADGSFTGTIAKRGSGPREFNQVTAFAVDDHERFFLFHNMGQNRIYKYNLDKNRFEEDLPFVDHGSLSSLIWVNDSLLMVVPARFADYGYLWFFQTMDGRITAGKEQETIPHPGAWAGFNTLVSKGPDGTIYMQPSESDTLFMLAAEGMEPLVVITPVPPVKQGDITKGARILFQHLEQDRVFFSEVLHETMITHNRSSIRALENNQLIYDRHSGKIYRASPLYVNLEGIDLELPFVFIRHNQFISQFAAWEFKEKLGEALVNGRVPASRVNDFNTLYMETDENDNPIIIVGTND
ncbi:MAG: 6-bladed beta-propeller [Bacteroidia bacterium]|nr:MAG: 6-bladed beta-propeller [Bacteroidia bacterium]